MVSEVEVKTFIKAGALWSHFSGCISNLPEQACAIQTLAALGLTITGVTGDVYLSAVGPTAVTVFVQKIWDGIAKKAKS